MLETSDPGLHLQVLRQAAPPCHQLPQEKVWAHEPAATKEEDQIGFMSVFCQHLLLAQLAVFDVEQAGRL